MDPKRDTKVEMRRMRRSDASRTAIVVYGEKHAISSATVLDISSSGARIEIPPKVRLPDTFFVIDPIGKTVYLCAMMHCTANICGVKFVNRHPLASLPPSLDFLRKYRE